MATPEVVGNHLEAESESHPEPDDPGDPGRAFAETNPDLEWRDVSNDRGMSEGPVELESGFGSATSRHSRAEDQARMVRQHEDEVIMQHFHRWILLFSLIICMATPAMIGLLVWLLVAYLEYRHVDCDVPLHLWVHVVCLIVSFNSTINRPTPTGSCVQRCLCRWRRDPHDPQPMPFRVRLYNLVITVFVFVWNCAGLHWIRVDGSAGGDLPACHDVAPALYVSVKVYAAFNLAITLFMYVNMFGFAQLLRIALHRGILHTSNAAPAGSLEQNTEEAKCSDISHEISSECSICLESWDEATPIVKTKGCDHFFHTKCLQGWLKVNKTCPLCRLDLSKRIPSDGRQIGCDVS